MHLPVQKMDTKTEIIVLEFLRQGWENEFPQACVYLLLEGRPYWNINVRTSPRWPSDTFAFFEANTQRMCGGLWHLGDGVWGYNMIIGHIRWLKIWESQKQWRANESQKQWRANESQKQWRANNMESYKAMRTTTNINPDSKGHGANMGPTWVLSAPGGPHVSPINLSIRECYLECQQSRNQYTRSLELFVSWLFPSSSD